MIRSVLALVIGLVVLAACESRTPSGPTGSGDTSESSQEEIGERHDSESVESSSQSGELGIDLEELLAGAFERDAETQELLVLDRLNEPNRVSAETIANRHRPDLTDTIRTLHYDGVELTIHHAPDGKELLETIRLTDSDVETPEGLRVGMTRSDVESSFGEPLEADDDSVVYEQNGPMPTRHVIHYEDQVITRIEWRYAID